MLRNLIVLCAVLSLSLFTFAQENAKEVPKAEIFGGYQFVRASTGISGASGFNGLAVPDHLSAPLDRYPKIARTSALIPITP